MQWIRSVIEFLLAIVLLGATVCSIPQIGYYFNIFCILVVIFIFYLNNKANRRKCMEKIALHKKIDEIENIDIYALQYKEIGSHNVLVLQGDKNSIVVEKGVLDALTNEEKKAVFLHECGHCHTLSQRQIFAFQCIALAMSATGLHLLLYCDMYILCVIGIIACLMVEYLKRYIEDAADKYAIRQGCGKEYLISAISKIESMNEESTRIKMSNHPKLQKRINKIQEYEY